MKLFDPIMKSIHSWFVQSRVIDKAVRGPNGNPSDPLVQIVAHDNIRLLSGAHIKPNIVLKIDKAIYGIPEAHPAGENEIT